MALKLQSNNIIRWRTPLGSIDTLLQRDVLDTVSLEVSPFLLINFFLLIYYVSSVKLSELFYDRLSYSFINVLIYRLSYSLINVLIYQLSDGTWSRPISRSKRDRKPKSNDDFYYY